MEDKKTTRPSYKTNDPRGWCGDPRRGAALGRTSKHRVRKPNENGYDQPQPDPSFTGKLVLRQVRLDSGGYDVNGTYYGQDVPLWWYADDEGTIDVVIRAKDRELAKAKVRELYPNARFWR